MLLLLLLFLLVLFDYVLYASLLVCKRPSIALGTVLWHLPCRLCVVRFNVSRRCLMLFIILVVCGSAMDGCLRFYIVMVFSICVFLKPVGHAYPCSYYDKSRSILQLFNFNNDHCTCRAWHQLVYRLIADTSRSQAQSIQSVIVISGYLPFGNNCRDICNGTKPDCNTHYSWHIDTKPHW
jgi:hypothetical protein